MRGEGSAARRASRSSRIASRRRRSMVAADSVFGRRRRATPRTTARNGAVDGGVDVVGRAAAAGCSDSGSPVTSIGRPSARTTSISAASSAGAATDSNGPSPSIAASAYRHISRSWSQCQRGSRTRNQYVTPSTSRRSAIPAVAAQRSSRWSESLYRSCASSAAANHGRIETTSDRSAGPGVQAGSRTTVDRPGTGGGVVAAARRPRRSARVRRSSTGAMLSRAGSDRAGVGACIVPEGPPHECRRVDRPERSGARASRSASR